MSQGDFLFKETSVCPIPSIHHSLETKKTSPTTGQAAWTGECRGDCVGQ